MTKKIESLQVEGKKDIVGEKEFYSEVKSLTKDDIAVMNPKKYSHCINKDTLWPKPNYLKMAENGYNQTCLYFIKLVRDALPAKPQVFSEEFINIYMNLFHIYKATCLELKTENSLQNAYNLLIKKTDELEYKHLKNYSVHRRAHSVVNDLTFNPSIKISKLKYEAIIQNFPYEEPKGSLKGVTITPCGSKFSITKNGRLIAGIPGVDYSYSTAEEALDVALKIVKPHMLGSTVENKNISAKKDFRPPLKEVKRVGENYRKGRNITPTTFLNTFGFRGSELRGWRSEKDYQQSLNHAYDSFLDLMSILEAQATFASLGGYKGKKLAIAFASSNLRGTAAHYEHSNAIMNLTNTKGVGSLAHEWAHALDNFIGIKCGFTGSFTKYGLKESIDAKTTVYYELQYKFRELMNIIQYSTKDIEDSDSINLNTPKVNSNKNDEYSMWIYSLVKNIEASYTLLGENGARPLNDNEKALIEKAKADFLNCINLSTYQEMIDTFEEVTGRETIPSPQVREKILWYVNLVLEQDKESVTEENALSKQTAFYTNAQEADKNSKVYFSKHSELFARAFESYIEDTLTSQGKRNDYLVYGTSNEYDGFKIFPEGEERFLINTHMNSFLKAVVTSLGDEEFSKAIDDAIKDALNSTGSLSKLVNIKDSDVDDFLNSLGLSENDIEAEKLEEDLEEDLENDIEAEELEENLEEDLENDIEAEELEENLEEDLENDFRNLKKFFFGDIPSNFNRIKSIEGEFKGLSEYLLGNEATEEASEDYEDIIGYYTNSSENDLDSFSDLEKLFFENISSDFNSIKSLESEFKELSE